MYIANINIHIDTHNIDGVERGTVRGAAINEQEQTPSNLTVVAAAFSRSAAQLVGERTFIPNTVSSLQFC